MAGKKQQYFYDEGTGITTSQIPDFFMDIRRMIVELVLFEALDKPYITGQIAISDDKGLFDGMGFSGTERLHIKMLTSLETATGDSQVMDRDFILTGIETVVKSSNSGQSSIYVLSFMDEHAFVSKTKYVSRSFKDNLKEEVRKLVGNEVGKQLDLTFGQQDTVKNNFKGIIPYMHPLEAATWLTEKATDNLGMPWFLYSTMFDTNLRMSCLRSLLEQPVFNESLPYIFSPANTQAQEEQPDPDLKFFQVQSMKTSKIQNTMNQMMMGGIGSRLSVTDLSNGLTTSRHYSFYDALGKADDAGVINITKQNVYNSFYSTPDLEEVNYEGDNLHNLDSKIFHKVVSRGVYGDKKSVHDEINSGNYLRSIDNLAFRNAIYKNMMDITVPGPGFISTKRTIGDKMRIHVLSDDNDPDSPSKLDRMRSGDFIIFNTRHTFKDTRHDVAMSVFKLERGDV